MESYVLYSRQDPHYKVFFKSWLVDSDLRYCLYMAVHTRLPFYDHQIRIFISEFFESRRGNILRSDIEGIYKQCNDDIQRLDHFVSDVVSI